LPGGRFQTLAADLPERRGGGQPQVHRLIPVVGDRLQAFGRFAVGRVAQSANRQQPTPPVHPLVRQTAAPHVDQRSIAPTAQDGLDQLSHVRTILLRALEQGWRRLAGFHRQQGLSGRQPDDQTVVLHQVLDQRLDSRLGSFHPPGVSPSQHALRLLPQIALRRPQRRQPQVQRSLAEPVFLLGQLDRRIVEHDEILARLRNGVSPGWRSQHGRYQDADEDARKNGSDATRQAVVQDLRIGRRCRERHRRGHANGLGSRVHSGRVN
jgi:hypothetical protein